MIGFEDAATRRGFWRGFLAGIVAAAVVASCMSPPRAHAAESDGEPFAVATSETGSSVTLHTGRGLCVGEARAAVWRPAPGSDAAPVPGCWIITGGTVLVSFLDGERGDIPVARLVKARAL